MSHWRASLCNNKPHDILIDSTILLAIPLAFLPQIHQLYATPTTSGMSAYYLLFNEILSSTQLSMALMKAAYEGGPTSFLESVQSGRMKGWKLFGAALGILQLAMIWLCSVLQLSLYSIRSSTEGPNSHTLTIIAALHAVIFLIPTIKITLPVPAKREMGLGFYLAFLSFTSVIVMPLSLVLQFCAQLGVLRNQNGNFDSVSLLSWCLQIPVLAAVAFRWVCRTGLPPYFPSEQYGTHYKLWLRDIVCCFYVHCMISVNLMVWASEMYLLVAYYLWTNWERVEKMPRLSGP